MDIFVNGVALDMSTKDASIHSSRIRFANALADSYTEDLELPKTSNNMKLLGCYMLLEGELIGKKISAIISRGVVSVDGYIQVTAISDDSITATAYLSRIPTDLIDKKLTDILIDDEDTIIDWNKDTETAGLLDNCGVWKYYQGLDATYSQRMCKPSIKISALLSRLSSATGLTFPSYRGSEVLTATGMVESRGNFKQTIVRLNEGTLLEPSNKCYRGTSAWSLPDSETDTAIDFTCNATITGTIHYFVELSPDGTASCLVSLIRGISTAVEWEVLEGEAYTVVSDIQFEWAVQKGDRLVISDTDNGTIDVAVEFTYSNIDDADEDDHELTYIAASKKVGSTEVIGSLRTYCLNHYGVIANLDEIKIRDLLTSLCWYFGKTLHVANSVMTFVDADATHELQQYAITKYDDAADILAKKVLVEDASERVIAQAAVIGDSLEDEAVLHKSSFYICQQPDSSSYIASIPEFIPNDKGDGIVQSDEIEDGDIDGIPISIPALAGVDQRPTGEYLRPVTMSEALFVEPYRALGVTIETRDDVSDAEFVTIDQHKFAISEVDTDVDGISTITAIKI